MRAALAEKEAGAFGAESMEVGVALYELGSAYMDGRLRQAPTSWSGALRIYEREYPSDNTAEVAQVLDDLGNAYYSLGDYAKARDVDRRALAINEREYGHGNHAEVADVLKNLGNAYYTLGDIRQVSRDDQERALTIKERDVRPRPREVAKTLRNPGNARLLGDHAKARHVGARARDQGAGRQPPRRGIGHPANEPRERVRRLRRLRQETRHAGAR